METEQEYKELHEVISFEGFDFKQYGSHELEILLPRLKEKGFRDVVFHMGECDSFGPLTRTVSCVDVSGTARKFIYG